MIRANGDANLFLINPAGIIFGENARLDLGGSFLGGTSSSILFEDGEFSATDSENPPLLTINAPIGLNFPDNPQPITNRSVSNESGLQVNPRENITFIGGEINFEGGRIFAPGSNVELGGLSAAGEIGINNDGSLSFPDGIERADVTFTNGAEVDVRSSGGGSITVNAGNIDLSGESGASNLFAGIAADSDSTTAQAEDITLNAGDTISVSQGSRISNRVEESGVGNSGEINITTGSLSVTNTGRVDASTAGQGNAGDITINASDSITIDGNPDAEFATGVGSAVAPQAVGDGGNITIATGSLSLTNTGGVVSASTSGQGNAGDITVNATDSITITIDGNPRTELVTGVLSFVGLEAVGDGGNITLTTGSLSLTNGGIVNSSTFAEGNAGDTEINASESILISGTGLNFGFNPNNPDIDPRNPDLVEVDVLSGLYADTLIGNGNGGNINVVTNQLTINDGGTIQAGNFEEFTGLPPGTGEPGNINIEANSLNLSNQARIDAATQAETGNTANINLQIADEIILRDNSFISAQAFNNANGGNLTIDTNFIVAFPSNGDGNDLIASAAQGDGGNINITAESLFGISEGEATSGNRTNDIDASSEFGLDGAVTIDELDVKPVKD